MSQRTVSHIGVSGPAATVVTAFALARRWSVFTVGGKLFAIVSLADVPGRVRLKCDSGYAVALREQFPAVTAGYHLNKRHWNTVVLDGSVLAEMLDEWIQDLYEFVLARLTRAERAKLD